MLSRLSPFFSTQGAAVSWRNDLGRIILLVLLFLMLSFAYFTLRSLKDIYLIQHIGVEAIYYVKLFGVTPGMILLTILYSKVSQRMDRDRRFNSVVLYFLVFFVVTNFILIPYLDFFRLDGLADGLMARAPSFYYLWETVRFWPLTLFYIHAEAWGVIVQGVLFWTFVNEITSLQQSKALYGFLPLGLGIAFLLEGFFLHRFKDQFHIILSLNLIVIGGILLLYNSASSYLTKHIKASQRLTLPTASTPPPSLRASFRLLLRSDYLTYMAQIVISYGVVTSLFEALWKSKVKVWAGESTSRLVEIYSMQATVGGTLAILLTLLVAAPIMHKGWRFAASFVPIASLVATLLFCGSLFFQTFLGSWFSADPLMPVVYIGLVTLIFIKMARYTVFDPNKERVYIPLTEEEKVQGKAAVDGLGTRLGKSLGSLIMTLVLVPLFGTIDDAQYGILVVILLTLFFWLRATERLSVLFETLVKNSEK